MKAPMRATKKPVTLNFIEWTGKNLFAVITFMQGKPDLKSDMAKQKWEEYGDIVKREGLIIHSLEGDHIAAIGDMVMQGVKGEFYYCKPDVFALLYTVEDDEEVFMPMM